MKKVEELLDKYFEGETTVQEERWLKEYFSNASELPTHLVKYRDMFGFYQSEQEISSNRHEQNRGRHTIIRRLWPIAAAAACVAALLLVDLSHNETPVVADRVEKKPVKVQPKVTTAEVQRQDVSVKKAGGRKALPPKSRVSRKVNRVKPPAADRNIRDAFTPIKEMNKIDENLKNMASVGEIDVSLSPLSNLAYLDTYFTAKNSQDTQNKTE